jgi:hypothetical protein
MGLDLEEESMPEISRFYGIVIKMFFRRKEHNPPHFHAIYGEYVSEFDINTLDVIIGDLPAKAVALVKEWGALHQKELMSIWDNQSFEKITPLE